MHGCGVERTLPIGVDRDTQVVCSQTIDTIVLTIVFTLIVPKRDQVFLRIVRAG